ncbi:MAG TPA: putative metal-dependent hydrolase [Terriglobia bacterium]|nr:putative metal-dependent hydrolase [Terriglobia bacterium]
MTAQANDLRYPVGKFHWQEEKLTFAQREHLISEIEQAPARLRAAVAGLSDAQLDTPYRESGWTVRQVVHHLADSHINAYIRFRLALTEQEPQIKPYNQDDWAKLVDARTAPIELSLRLLESLHQRWVLLLKSMTGDDFARTLRHPEQGVVGLDRNLAIYAWHGRHHVAQINSLRERSGWGARMAQA